MKSKRKTSSSGASCDGVSLCLYLAFPAFFASPAPCIKLYGYDFGNIVSTKIHSLDHSTNCDNKIGVSKTKEEGSLTYAQVHPEIKLKFCMYKAVYTVSALKKSNIYDDVVFLTENSGLLKSVYPLNARVCRNIWQNKNFAIPGFGDWIFKVNRSVTEKLLRQTSETTYIEEHSQSFMTKNGRKSAMYAEPVDWTSPAGQKLIRNVVINAKIYIGTIWGKLHQRNLLNFKDPLGFLKTVFIKAKYFEDDLENYFFENQMSKH